MDRHPARLGRLLLPALVALLAACTPGAAVEVVAEAGVEATAAVEDAQGGVAAAVTPAILEVQDILQEALPLEPQPMAPTISPAAAALIVRWEVTSQSLYERRYQGVICPGGASGPTIGIGYDLGHQTSNDIQRDWAFHPDVYKLATGSGEVGETRCKAWRSRHLDIRIPYTSAYDVFARHTLPVYEAGARRALSDGWELLPPDAQGGNVSLGYNRGWSMSGSRNSEKRVIRDTCVPAGDLQCNGAQLRAMCRIWAGTPNGKGLCARRNDEANLVERATWQVSR